MNRITATLALLTALVATNILAFSIAEDEVMNPLTFDQAQWIGSTAEPNAAAGSVYYRAQINCPPNTQIQKAQILITADNLFALYVNGKFAGQRDSSPNEWDQPLRFDITHLLSPGSNTLAVHAVNTAPGPAGLLATVSVDLSDGRQVVCNTDETWRCVNSASPKWRDPDFDDSSWSDVHVYGGYGVKPWNAFGHDLDKTPVTTPGKQALPMQISNLRAAPPASSPVLTTKPPADYAWPEGIVFLGDDCSLYNTSSANSVIVFTHRKSRAYPEHDPPSPVKMGRKLYALTPARPGVKPQLLVDAGNGAIGSPSVSFDGQWIYFSMAAEGDSFFHIYRLPAEGGTPKRLTDGPFHDIDPAELPDGRIVFTSTRIGTFEEYHSPPSRALFTMKADGSEIHPLTHTIIFDNEPEVMADGRIVFIRTDNFFDRGKVETRLHSIHPDGTEGYTEFGLGRGPEYGNRLRAYYCGSPAPMPDGRLAFVSKPGITIGHPGNPDAALRHFVMPAGDVASLPDNRLLCTVGTYETIAIMHPDAMAASASKSEQAEESIAAGGMVTLFESAMGPVHSPVYLGARPRPPVLPDRVGDRDKDAVDATGFLYCQNVRFTDNTTAGWQHVRAVRVLAGKGLTTRSSHAYIVHAGSEVVELGTVPIAPDGSIYVEVPADTPIAFQAVDADGRSELNEMSWIYVRPGETRGCVGCHQSRTAAPTGMPEFIQALTVKPLKLVGAGKPHRFRGNNAAVTGLMEMQFDRFRQIAGLSRHSESSDPLATGVQEVAALIAQLNGDDPGLKISSAQRLAIFRDQTAAPALTQQLTDQDRETRVATALALATCGTRQSIPPLLNALTDTDPLVAQAAAIALESLTGHGQAFHAFAELDERRKGAERWRVWFEQHPWPTIERDLIQQLTSEDRDVVRRSATALGHVGGDDARAALRAYVERASKDNPYPQWKQRHRGDGTRFNSLSQANPRTLQAATRSLGYLKDAQAVPLLAATIAAHSDPKTANLFLAEAAAEALGRIGTPDAIAAVIKSLAELQNYHEYVGWYGDHEALFACHASPLHYLLTEALDRNNVRKIDDVVGQLIRSVPTDPDRALMLGNDDCETLVGRVLRRGGMESQVVETCLAILGDPKAQRTKTIEQAIATTHGAWAGKPDVHNRAAQFLSLVCRNRAYRPRIQAALERYRRMPNDDFVRVYGGHHNPTSLPVKQWVCFFLARTLGHLEDPASVDTLIQTLEQSPVEAAGGRPDPTGAGVIFLHNEPTPCYRAAAAWALGRIADRRAMPVLMAVIEDLENATDTRHAASEALHRMARPSDLAAIQKLASDYPEISIRKSLLRLCAALERSAELTASE